MDLLPEGLNLSQPVPRIQMEEHGQKIEQVKKKEERLGRAENKTHENIFQRKPFWNLLHPPIGQF